MMKQSRTPHIFLLLGIVSLSIVMHTHTQGFESDSGEMHADGFDHSTDDPKRFFGEFDFSADDFLDPSTDDFLSDLGNEPLSLAVTKASPEDIVQFLTSDDIRADLILQEDFYLRTNPLNKRDLLDLPAFELPACTYCDRFVLGMHLFVNQTSRNNFTKSSTNLVDYLALGQDTLIEKLQVILDKARETSNDLELAEIANILGRINIDELFNLFRTMSTQERRAGFMFELTRMWDRLRMRVLLPLYYRERNFWLTEDEQDNAERTIAEAFGITSSQDEQDEFTNDHLIADKFGFGDTRFEFDWLAYENCNFSCIRLGLQFTFPTAFAFKKGIRGNSFEKPCHLPPFDLGQFACVVIDSIAPADPGTDTIQQALSVFADQLQPFLFNVIDRLSANLLETGLGNGGHVGIGILMRNRTSVDGFLSKFSPYARIKHHCPWIEYLTWQSRMSLEWLTPREKKRAYVQKNDPAAFANRDFQSNDPVIQADNLAFLEREIIQKLTPSFFGVTVRPGVIFHSTSKLCYQGCKWDFYIGTDTWIKTRDNLTNIQAPVETKIQLDHRKAKPFWAYQGRAMVGLVRRFEREDKRNWHISLHGDKTISGSGIGRDWTAALNFEAVF